MIIGPDFVFIAVPRTASNAMARLFLPKFGGQNYGKHHLRTVPERHRRKFTFAVVRNPYDRVFSMWYHLRRHDPKRIPDDFPKFVDILMNNWGEGGLHQAAFLAEARIDRVLKYEQLHLEVLQLPFAIPPIRWPMDMINREDRPFWSEDLRQHPDWAEHIERHSGPDFVRYQYATW